MLNLRVMRILLSGLILCALAGRFHVSFADEASPQMRVWKDNTGKFEIQAALVKAKPESVILRRESDGRIIEVPLARLSAADQQYLRSRSVDNPFLVVEEKVPTVQSLLVVRMKSSRGTKATTGLLIHKEDGQAFVACRNLRLSPEELDEAAISLHWKSDGELKTVPARLVSPYDRMYRKQTYLLSTAADTLPAALVRKPIEFNLPLKVTTFGFQITTTEPLSFTAVSGEGSVESFQARPGHPKIMSMKVTSRTPMDSIAFLPDGTPVACLVAPSGRGGTNDDVRSASGMHYSEFDALLQPQLTYAHIAPVTGDRSSIKYAVAAFVSDPLNQATKCGLALRRIDSTRTRIAIAVQPREDGTWPAIPEAQPVNIVDGFDPAKLDIGAPSAGRYPHSKVLVGHITLKNPGPVERHEFMLQLAMTQRQGEVHSSPTSVAYHPKTAVNVPDIPGLDLKPLDMPRPVKVEGGWKITSDVTRVPESENEKPDSPPFPRAEGGLDTPVEKRKANNGSVGGRFACYSPDGRWLFLLEELRTLCKFDAETMKEVARVRLSSECWDISFCKAGMLLTAMNSDRIWVIDPEMLSLRNEIVVPKVRIVAGSPSSDVGFAFTQIDGSGRANSFGGTLYMINFRTGKKLHRVGTFREKLDDQTAWPIGLFWTMRMSPDGKYLYTFAGGPSRFRVEGENLIFEEAGKATANSGSTTRGLEVSHDGLLIVVPGKVFNWNNLATPYVTITEGLRGGYRAGVDPVTEDFYTLGHNGLTIFDKHGSLKENVAQNHSYPGDVVVHPKGRRIVTWRTAGTFHYYDLRDD